MIMKVTDNNIIKYVNGKNTITFYLLYLFMV